MKTIFSAVMVIVVLIASIATTSTVFAITDFESLESHCVIKEQEAHLTYEVLEPTNVKIVVTTNDVVTNTFYFTNAGEQRVEIRAEWTDIVKFFVYLDGNSPAIVQTVDMNQCFIDGTPTPTSSSPLPTGTSPTNTPILPTATPTTIIIPPFVNIQAYCTDRNTAVIEFTANYDTGNFVRVYEADTITQYEDGMFPTYSENIFDGMFRESYVVTKHFTIFELQEERSEMLDPIIVDMFECEPVATSTPVATVTLQPVPTNTPVETPTAEPTIPSELFKDVVAYCDGDNAILEYFAFYDYGNVTEIYFDGAFHTRDVNPFDNAYRLTIQAPNVSTVTFALFDERFVGNIITKVVDMTECDKPPVTPTVLPPTTPNTVYVPDVRH